MAIDTYLSEKLQQGLFSGYQYWIDASGQNTSGFAGKTFPDSKSKPVTESSVFDLASITKLFTATLAAVLHDRKVIDLDDPISNWAPAPPQLAHLSTRELLTHTAGLPAEWKEFDSREKTIDSLLAVVPDDNQRGKILYSCTGYSLFSVMLEKAQGRRFDDLLDEFLLRPLGLSKIVYNPNDKGLSAVSTEPGNPLGLVHDPRARAMDGVSGNAGLFSSANDLARFFIEITNPNSQIITQAVKDILFTTTADGEWKQAVGFRHADRQRVGSAVNFFSHTGFTGTLALVEPASQKVAILLTNRLAGNTSKEQMAEVYMTFSELVGGEN